MELGHVVRDPDALRSGLAPDRSRLRDHEPVQRSPHRVGQRRQRGQLVVVGTVEQFVHLPLSAVSHKVWPVRLTDTQVDETRPGF